MNPEVDRSEEEPLNDCIGNLEHHVHKVFALVRVPGEDFVYSASIDLFRQLDEYCDEAAMLEPRPPFLIKGESGAGKSALLSNWLQRRERSLLKSRTADFVFWHAVGCSRQSMNVHVVIRRLITELKDKFEISRPLPRQQDRYSWELPRFLDLAAKRGRVIIVIDGLNRLVNNEGAEDSLAWLPLEFPPNVRVILSVTIPTTHLVDVVGLATAAVAASNSSPKLSSLLSASSHQPASTSATISPFAASAAPSPTKRERGRGWDRLKIKEGEEEEKEGREERPSIYAAGEPLPRDTYGKKSRILTEL
eukprot:CAMPEP_0173190036 /NCGR_PEP_ID=MMETSP1141-20130122/12128_1 /TAXON_ID=483371 /ORGANISM="non described non described, Strain CCMP2298" /LENGTH=305 /DNA_ID=CAMNT_0014114113 /DNA_START=63 /DNA_END=977 /DNA_ORIENTATION=+